MKIKANLRILENANKQIESIACGSKPAARHNLHLNVWLTRTQSLLLRSNDNVR